MLPQYLPPHNVETPHGLSGTGQLKSRGRCAVALVIVCACFSVSKQLVALVQLCYWEHWWILLLLVFIVLSKPFNIKGILIWFVTCMTSYSTAVTNYSWNKN
jgi:hypothetical protein